MDEPTADVVRDRHGNVWQRDGQGQWWEQKETRRRWSYGLLERTWGPLVPMIDAPRPEGVPDWARARVVWLWSTATGMLHSDGLAANPVDYPGPPAPEPTYSITLGPHTWEKASNGDWIDPAREGLDAHHTSTLGIALARIEQLEVTKPVPEPTLVEPDDGESNYEPPLRYTENDMDEQAEVYFRSGWKAAMAQENPPEPTLVEQARDMAKRQRQIVGQLDSPSAALLDALADELENRHE